MEETVKTPSPDATLEKLKVVQRPDKTEYKSGEEFDPSGMIIHALYSDGGVIENVEYEVLTKVIPPKTTAAQVKCMDQTLSISIKVVTAGNAEEYSVANTETIENSPVSGNVYFWLGSSVTYGAESEGETMADFFAKKWSCTSVKEAVSGTTLSTKAPNSYVERFEKYLQSADRAEHLDGFICQLSTNDTRYPDDLGIIMPAFITGSDAFDTATTFGAMEYIIAKAKETWGCPVYFYTNPPYNNTVYPSMVDGLMKIAEKWDVRIIDLYHDEQFNQISDEQRALYMSDSIHPTKAGYREWWLPKFEKALIPE
ncbi:MAG: SGNH/GDSL hydrolase family protein [Oscillospiraceae bacterium]|nr:SGNH/GDSL hydrolase family protein [Oscillospiraceae bacterium]